MASGNSRRHMRQEGEWPSRNSFVRSAVDSLAERSAPPGFRHPRTAYEVVMPGRFAADRHRSSDRHLDPQRKKVRSVMNQRSRRATAILGRATIAWSMAMLPGLAWAATPPSKTFDPAAATWSSSDASDLQIADNKSQPLVPPRQTQGQHGTGQPAQNHHVQPAQPKYVQQQHSVQPTQPKYVQQQHSVQPTQPKYVQQQHSVQPTQPKYVQQQHSVQPAQRHYVTQQSKGPQYWTHQTQRYDWQAYRQGQRPPQ